MHCECFYKDQIMLQLFVLFKSGNQSREMKMDRKEKRDGWNKND